MENKFFGSKLNSVLLLFLIILMIVALVVMSKNKELYLNGFKSPGQSTEIQKKENPESVNTEILGNKDDLISFSINPGQQVSGKMKVNGSLKGGYFFEGNLPVSILDENKNLTSYGPGHGQASTDWMTAGPVSFSIDFDFAGIPKGEYYIKLTADDPSGGESGLPLRSVLIPVVIN